jgi:pSer/pThr/pTyr-binding forkhead associated (FHA) protein
MRVVLRKIYGIGFPGEMAVRTPECSIGRSHECDLRLACPMVSRRHCELIVRGQELTVRDLNSRNGTFVNGLRVTGERRLLSGDELEMGMSLWRIEIDSQTGSDVVMELQPASVGELENGTSMDRADLDLVGN